MNDLAGRHIIQNAREDVKENEMGVHLRGDCTSLDEIGSALRTYIKENVDPFSAREVNIGL